MTSNLLELSSVARKRFSVGWEVNISGPRRLAKVEIEEAVEGGLIPEVKAGILLAIALFSFKISGRKLGNKKKQMTCNQQSSKQISINSTYQ